MKLIRNYNKFQGYIKSLPSQERKFQENHIILTTLFDSEKQNFSESAAPLQHFLDVSRGIEHLLQKSYSDLAIHGFYTPHGDRGAYDKHHQGLIVGVNEDQIQMVVRLYASHHHLNLREKPMDYELQYILPWQGHANETASFINELHKKCDFFVRSYSYFVQNGKIKASGRDILKKIRVYVN